MPAKFKVSRLFTRGDIGFVVAGKVLSGCFRAGDVGRCFEKKFYVMSICSQGSLKEQALEGDELCVWVKGIGPDDLSPGNHLFF